MRQRFITNIIFIMGIFLLSGFVMSCTETNVDSIEQGDLDQECYPNGTCNAGLKCEDNKCVEDQGSDGDTDVVDGDDVDGDDVDGDDVDGDDTDGDDTDGDDVDGDDVDGDDTDGDDVDGDDVDGDDVDGDDVDGDDVDGDDVDGDDVDGDDVDSDDTDGDDTDGDDVDGDEEDLTGTEGEKCFPNDSCFAGLVCENDICVKEIVVDGDDETVDGDEEEPVNPCLENDPCASTNQVCINDNGSAVCGNCLNGFHWNGAGDACTDDLCDPNNCVAALHQVCDATTGDCKCDAGYCDIDGTCVADGTIDALHVCRKCDVNSNINDWTIISLGTECRDAVDGCDATEYCDGLSIDCPADEFAPEDTACGFDTETTCDEADTCDGMGNCQANYKDSSTVCREALSDCDIAEYCDNAGSCAEDRFQPANTLCGSPDNTVCTNPDTCDGSGTCLENHEDPTLVCREAKGECDVAEQCTENGVCPADQFAAVDTACGLEDDTDCDNPDKCDGQGTCLDNFEDASTSCRAATDLCDIEEFCDGMGSCPDDELVSCDENNTCYEGDCLASEVPGRVIISEVLYNSAGVDNETFVELYGDVGLDLAGFVLQGVNGANNETYNTIALSGVIPQSGYFLVVNSNASSSLLNMANQVDSKADYQNGPDSIQVLYLGEAVDSLGYGDFSSASFAGEGNPAAGCDEDQSLARDAMQTDTDDNASDFYVLDLPTPGVANTMPNQSPTASLSCPVSINIGETAVLNASASSDADGSIVEYRFEFGNGTVSIGAEAVANYIYTTGGTYNASVQVTDNLGAKGNANCTIVVTDGNAPQVVLVRPIEDLIITQGDSIIVEADTTPSPGRTIAKVELVADGEVVGEPMTEVPYRFTYTVADLAETGSTIQIQAKATDDEGAEGISAARILDVQNYEPVATFTAVITDNLQITVDASGVSDNETAVEELEVRWDWDNDGTWTDWSIEKVAVHEYTVDGEHTIGMEVRDAVGQTDSASRTIDFQMVQDVNGEITSTLWMGTINITGDCWVPQNNTLRIASGTTIIFYGVDTDQNGIGDFDLTVHGKLSVEGTEAAPVVFTMLGTLAPSGWNQIELASDSTEEHVISHAVFEYGHTALYVRSAATIENCEFRENNIGVKVYTASGTVNINDTTIRDSVDDGLYIYNSDVVTDGIQIYDNGNRGAYIRNASSASFTDCLITRNASHGTFIWDSDNADFDNCQITYNGETGMFWQGDSNGDVTHSNIKYNDHEGIRGLPYGSYSPTPVINYNNIMGNSVVGSLYLDKIDFSFETTASQSGGTYTSSTWSTPSSEKILFMNYSYYESSSSSALAGYIDGMPAGTQVMNASSTTSNIWKDLSSYEFTGLKLKVYDSNSYYYGRTTVSHVGYFKEGQVSQVSVYTKSSPFDIKHNYFGAWPDVLPVISYNSSSQIDLQGFVGVAYDENWDKGNYKGGEVIDTEVTWDEDVFVSGDVTIESGGTLNIEAGVTVTFLPTDTSGNNQGDWQIYRKGGDFNVNGTSGNEVLFTVLGDVPTLGGFKYLQSGSGSGVSTISYATVEKANRGFNHSNGTLNLSHVTVKNCKDAGIYAYSSLAILNGDYLTLEYNNGWGLYFSGNKAVGNQIFNSTIRYNDEGGIYIYRSAAEIKNSNIQYNKTGVQLEGDSSGDIHYNNIKYNTSDGIFAKYYSSSTYQPSNVINNNNIFGNGTQEAGYIDEIALELETTASMSGGTYTGDSYQTGGPVIEYMNTSYYESSSSSSLTGYVFSYPGNSQISSFGSYSSNVWKDIYSNGYTGLLPKVYDSNSYYYARMTINKVFYHTSTITPPRVVELSAIMAGGTIDCTQNYWGAFDGTFDSKFVLSDSANAIDKSGFKTSEISGLGPLPE